MMIVLVAYLLLLMSLVELVHCQTFPYISFMSQTLADHSYVDISQVVTGNTGGVQCHTDLAMCCRGTDGPHRGDWYFPNGSRLQFPAEYGIVQRRVSQRVDIRRNSGTGPTGIYRCHIETDAVHGNDKRESVYAGLYTSDEGKVPF